MRIILLSLATQFVGANVKERFSSFLFLWAYTPWSFFWDGFSRHPTQQKHTVFQAKTYFYTPPDANSRISSVQSTYVAPHIHLILFTKRRLANLHIFFCGLHYHDRETQV